MRHTGKSSVAFLFLYAALFSGVFFISCGLDTTYSLTSPDTYSNYPSYSSENESEDYFDFTTKDSDNLSLESSSSGEFRYLGTGVYYKIYNNYSTLVSQRNAILAVNTSSNGSSAATKMIETYTFQQLGTKKNMSWSPFVTRSDVARKSNRRIRFRLKNLKSVDASSYSTETVALISKDYTSPTYAGLTLAEEETTFSYDADADVWTDNSDSSAFSMAERYPAYFIIPCRYDNEKTFDFFDDNDDDDNAYDIEPEEGDDDYVYSSSASAEDTYYVQLFAVAMGRNTTDFSVSYSLVLDLGSVHIEK